MQQRLKSWSVCLWILAAAATVASSWYLSSSSSSSSFFCSPSQRGLVLLVDWDFTTLSSVLYMYPKQQSQAMAFPPLGIHVFLTWTTEKEIAITRYPLTCSRDFFVTNYRIQGNTFICTQPWLLGAKKSILHVSSNDKDLRKRIISVPVEVSSPVY